MKMRTLWMASVLALTSYAALAKDIKTDKVGSYDHGSFSRTQTNAELGSKGDFSGGVYGGTNYDKPSRGGDSPGGKSGSSSESSGGVFGRYRF